jgi:hypothetical protein
VRGFADTHHAAKSWKRPARKRSTQPSTAPTAGPKTSSSCTSPS